MVKRLPINEKTQGHKTRALLFILALLSFSSAIQAKEDPRYKLTMSEPHKIEFLSEMRQMLASINGILEGIANDDREQIIQAAKYSGMRMARATPDEVRKHLPQEFQDIGGPTHKLFEEMAIRAEVEELNDLIGLTAEITSQCLACHARYRAD